jgi:hypothetical protein
VYIHDFVPAEQAAQLTEKELCELCFDTINAPLIQEYPELFKDSKSQ